MQGYAISFLNNPTAKDINYGHKKKPMSSDMFQRGTTDTSNLSMFQQRNPKSLKANNISRYKYKHLKTESEEFVAHLVARELQNNPKLILFLKRNIIQSLPAIKASILENQNIEINLRKAYINSTRNKKLLPTMLALASRGVLSFSQQSSDSLRASGSQNVAKHNRILYLTPRQQCSHLYRRKGKYCGLYANQLAITRFSPDIINALSREHKVCGSSQLLPWLLKALNVILPQLQSYNNILDKGIQFEALTSEEIAEGLLSGLYTRDQIRQSCDKELIKDINAQIKKRCI